MGYPHTVTVLSLALDRALFGTNPAGYHAVNLLVHLVNVILLYALLGRFGADRATAAGAAALFALHPLVVEPVCWVIGRKDLLSTALVLGALLVAAGPRGEAGPSSVRRWALVDGLVVAAMLAKPSALTAPALVWIVVRCLRPAESRRRLAVAVAPLVLAGAAIVLTGVPGLETQGAVVARTRAEVAFDVLRAWALQLRHVVWPRGLLVEYERTALHDPSGVTIALACAATLALVVYAARRLAPRSPGRTALVFVALAYLPAAGFLPTQHFTADSYFYLPLVGVALAIATIVAPRWERLRGVELVALGLAVLSCTQARTWSGAVAMFGPVAAHYADDPRPLNRLAFAYAHEHNEAAAARAYVELDGAFPDFPFNRGERAWAYAYLGDLRRSDAMLARCAEMHDAECAARLFADVVARRRDPRRVSRELLATVYPVAAEALPARLDAGGLRAVAVWLERAGLEELARRADADAAAAASGERRREP